MTWQREKTARVEVAGRGLQVTGWIGRRHCGCAYFQGMRLEDHEFTFGVTPCAEHSVQANRALDTMTTMEPSDEEIHLLWQRLLDSEIEP